jgi:hypothetical protein
MKQYLPLFCVLVCSADPVWASDVNLGNLNQSQFNQFSEDLGAAVSYKPVTPTAPLGVTGFDIGIEASTTKMRNLNVATGGSSNDLVAPKLHVYKGLPLNIDIGAVYAATTTDVRYYGAEIRYAILEGSVAQPAVGIRAAMTKLTGVTSLSLNTKSLDASISKGFAMFTPYAGIGHVWVDSTPDAATGLAKDSSQQNKAYAGGNLNLGVLNIALEYDKTGSAPTYSAKAGFRF